MVARSKQFAHFDSNLKRLQLNGVVPMFDNYSDNGAFPMIASKWTTVFDTRCFNVATPISGDSSRMFHGRMFHGRMNRHSNRDR